MFDCESGQVCIRRQITRRTDHLKQTKQDVGMSGSGMDEGRLWTVKPGPHPATGTAHVEWIVEDICMRRDTDETQEGNPGEAHCLCSIHERFPPLTRGLVPAGCRIVGIEQQVDVGNDHRSSFRASASASNSSAS